MRTNWKEIPRGDVMPQYAGIRVTMNPKGGITMSRRTFEQFGAPKAVLVLFDAVNNRIGLKPAGPGTRNAHPVNICNTKTGSRIVRCYRLIVEARIDLPGTVEFPDADIDAERILMLDLRTARPSRRALGRKAAKAIGPINASPEGRASTACRGRARFAEDDETGSTEVSGTQPVCFR